MSAMKQQLINILDEIVANTGISSSNLITEDGLVLAVDKHQNEVDEEINTNFSAISASILSMAERGIEIINTTKSLEQVKIDAGLDENLEEDFSILIVRVYSNVLLLVTFPSRINIGLIFFEVQKAIKEIRIILKKDDGKAIFSEIGSLL